MDFIKNKTNSASPTRNIWYHKSNLHEFNKK
jgi:hypothetical protein